MHFGQCDGEFAALLWILFVKGRFGGEQVRGGTDGDLLLQSAGAVPSAHQHEGVIRVRLQACDQLPLQVALHLDALLVIQDLTAGAAQVNCHTMTFILHCISNSQLLHLTLKGTWDLYVSGTSHVSRTEVFITTFTPKFFVNSAEEVRINELLLSQTYFQTGSVIHRGTATLCNETALINMLYMITSQDLHLKPHMKIQSQLSALCMWFML